MLAKKLSEDISNILGTALGDVPRPVPLHAPVISNVDISKVNDCLSTGWVSSVGAYVNQFEDRLCEITGARHAVAVVNGTSALHLSLVACGIRPEDEVLVPAFTFVATPNAVSYCGAIPHFVDSDSFTLGLDPVTLSKYLSTISVPHPSGRGICNKSTGRRISAVIPMHTFGHPVNMAPLLELADYYQLLIIEDAAESLGSFIDSKHTGTIGHAGILSFNGNKIITTGGGGAILTNDTNVALRVKHLSTTAKVAHQWSFMHDEVAWNYRMPNLNASLGCAQLSKLSYYLTHKRQLAKQYMDLFADHPDLNFVDEPSNTHSNFWMNTLLLSDRAVSERESILSLLQNEGYLCRPGWTLMTNLPMYESAPRSPLPIATLLSESSINIPSSPCFHESHD